MEISLLTCPKCGHRSSERMSFDACVFFYECTGCGTRVRPLPGLLGERFRQCQISAKAKMRNHLSI
ncbi:MAG TPA: GDCCVxC domain-containing (seleno)protein [Xanthobacteraceae bacterium]